MIEHTKKLVEDKFKTVRGYKHDAEVQHPEISFLVEYVSVEEVLLGTVTLVICGPVK